MALHLITGRAGVEHVTADNAGHLNAQILGANNFIFNVGEKFRYNLNSNNELRIYDGMGLLNGRQFELPSGTYEDLAIENGSQGMYRNDLVVARYSLDTNTGLENIEFLIITGEPNETEAVDPAYNEGDILEGDTLVDYPLYRIKLNGLNVTAVEDLFIVIDSISEQIGNADISDIGDGTIKGGLNSLNQKLAKNKSEVFAFNVTVDSNSVTAHEIDLSSLNIASILSWSVQGSYGGSQINYGVEIVNNKATIGIRNFFTSQLVASGTFVIHYVEN